VTHSAAYSDPEKTAEFYKKLDMVEANRLAAAKGLFKRFGTINMAVLRFKTKEAADRNDGLGPVFGLHHFGSGSRIPTRRGMVLKEAGQNIALPPETATPAF
jgi:hypothetical protein